MSRIVCLAIVMSGALLTWAGPALAGMSDGIAAVTVGDYPKAISEFEPLAASGDAAAQYQLAKLYLEGHGPADGVPRGIELMTKAANGNHPEAQAQLGLMYAMGLGVPVDNTKAYGWLTKAIDALPDGTRRTVAEANRDAVKKRMNPESTVIASAPAAAAPSTAAASTAPTKPAAAETAPAATVVPPPATAKPAAAKPAVAEAKTDPSTKVVTEAAKTKAATAEAKTDPSTKVVTEAAKTKATTEAKTDPSITAVADAAKTKPAPTATAPAATVAEVASTPSITKTPGTGTQVASAKSPEPESSMPDTSGPASQQEVQSGIRVQLASMPSEELAWKEWKRLSGQFGSQLSGLTAIVQPADLGQQGTFYRVQTGPFESQAAAEQRCSAMKQAGMSCLVIGTP